MIIALWAHKIRRNGVGVSDKTHRVQLTSVKIDFQDRQQQREHNRRVEQ